MPPTTPQAETARLLSVAEVASLLNVCERHVYRMADAGQLPRPLRIGRTVRWDRRALERWIDAGCPTIQPRSATHD